MSSALAAGDRRGSRRVWPDGFIIGGAEPAQAQAAVGRLNTIIENAEQGKLSFNGESWQMMPDNEHNIFGVIELQAAMAENRPENAERFLLPPVVRINMEANHLGDLDRNHSGHAGAGDERRVCTAYRRLSADTHDDVALGRGRSSGPGTSCRIGVASRRRNTSPVDSCWGLSRSSCSLFPPILASHNRSAVRTAPTGSWPERVSVSTAAPSWSMDRGPWNTLVANDGDAGRGIAEMIGNSYTRMGLNETPSIRQETTWLP